jgi:hypothetical protein
MSFNEYASGYAIYVLQKDFSSTVVQKRIKEVQKNSSIIESIIMFACS